MKKTTKRILYILSGIVIITAILIAGGRLALETDWVQVRLSQIGIRYMYKTMLGSRSYFNEPGLKAILCGTSSPAANLGRACSCTAVIADGRIFLVDAGGGSWNNILRWRMPADKIEGVLLTHFHSDHIQDLGEINMQTCIAGRPVKLAVYGGPGVTDVVSGFQKAYALDMRYRIEHHGEAIVNTDRYTMTAHTVARPNGASLQEGEMTVVFEDKGLKITAIGVNHLPVKPAYAYRFDYKDRSIVISGDTKASIKFAEKIVNCDVLIHEAMQQKIIAIMQQEMAIAGQDRLSHIAGNIQTFHATAVGAAEIANIAKAKLLIFTHLTPPLPEFIADPFFLKDVHEVRSKGVIVGYDGLVVTLQPDSDEYVLTDID